MRQSASFWLRRVPAFGAFLVSLLVLGTSIAQKPAGDPVKPMKKTPKDEEEEDDKTKPKLKPPLRIGDEDPSAKGHIGSKPIDLGREAELAKHKAVRDLYRRLAIPHDEVYFPVARAMLPVLPVPQFVGNKSRPDFAGKLMVTHIDAKGKGGKDEDITARQIKGIEHYETLALVLVEEFLKGVKDTPELKQLEALQTAEKALAEVLRYHIAALLNRQRTGPGWNVIEKELRARLLAVRLDQLQALADEREWPGVKELTEQLTEMYPGNGELRAAIIKLRGLQALLSLDDKNVETYFAARKGLEQLERLFPDAPKEKAIQQLRDRLQARAKVSLGLARELASRDKNRAVAELRTAENIWPLLPGLQELRQELKLFRPMGVGVLHLPQHLSPMTAATDVEKQAVELLFESLLRPVGDPQSGVRYEPVLATGVPQLVPMGRQFQMVRDARWYRGSRGSQDATIEEPVTANDVHRTVALYQKWAGRSPEWDELLGDALVESNPYRVKLALRQGYIDPLSLMTFKVLPAKYLSRPDDMEFARNPIGSGPYQYLGIKGDGRGGDFAQFVVNPTYGRRAGKTDTPRIEAIHFFRSKDPVGDFKARNMHLLLDLPTKEVRKLTDPGAGLRDVTVHTLQNRRVYFLAVNHRDAKLRNLPLRQALAHAINREKILNEHFRDKDGPAAHRPLNGPYPAGSWACDPGLPADPYRPDLAKSHARKAAAPEVELLYPNDLPGVKEACEAIADQAQLAGLKIKPRGASQAEVHRAVVLDQKYELAYYHWDHATDAYWLGPLFDARAVGRGGPNVLGRLDDPELERLFAQALSHRNFAEVQKLTRQIHNHLYTRMYVVPLWQIDTHIAVHADLKTTPGAKDLDPLRVFSNVDQWELAK